MKMRVLGRSGLRVSEYCLGAMMFGRFGNADRTDSVRIIHRAFDAGINFIDTAAIYGAGDSEEIVGEAIKDRRDKIVLATKIGQAAGLSRRAVLESVEVSLRRLGTDYIDLYQIHRPDPLTDIDETLGALSDLVHAGKVRVVGTSTFSPDQIVEAQWCAEKRGHVIPRSEQPPYSLMNRAIEGTTLPLAQKYGMGTMTWGPLSSGWLSGRPVSESRRAATMEGRRFDASLPENARKPEVVAALAALAAETGISLPHMAVAFVRAHPAVTSVIIGPRTMEQLEDLLGGVDVALDDGVLDRIDEIVPPGTDLNRGDAYAVPHPALADKALRRRAV